MISTEEQIKKIIFHHIDPKKHKVFLFGSRALGTAKKWSDYDIGISGNEPLDIKTKITIEEDLEKSNIPYFVQVVDFHNTSNRFKDIALRGAKLWN